MTTFKPLSDDSTRAIEVDMAAGSKAWNDGNLALAETSYLAAWNHIPEPKSSFDYSQTTARLLVDFYRSTQQYEKAYWWLHVLEQMYEADNPSIVFEAGMLDFEAGELEPAFAKFDKLFSKYKRRPFQGVDQKYLQFYLKRRG